MKLRRVDDKQSSKTGASWLRDLNPNLARRKFLAAAGVGLGLAALGPSLVREAEAAEMPAPNAPKTLVKTICGNCATGCGLQGVVQNDVWSSIEPWYEHPINAGSLCSKGSAGREHVNNHRRMRYPMKLEGGKWKRLSWDQAMGEITDKLKAIRQKYGPDALMVLGSAHHSNEAAYALRKFAGFWGSNNIDHQARICHSTTVAGLANTWGYGAMTNSMNDIRNSKAVFVIGENVCESHPIAMQHVLYAKEINKAPVIVVDPRFTKTAAFADLYVQQRQGTDVALIMGMVNVILKNGWEDKEMIRDRTYGIEDLKKELERYDIDTVADVTGVPKETIEKMAKLMADNRPGTVIWAMGGTQHSNGTSVTRSYCVLQLVLGNMGKSGGGTNVFRGHDNVQGATDLGVLSNTLPGYYGLGAGPWKHWSNVWGVDPDYIKSRFKDEKMMGKPGFTVARWYEGVLMDAKELGQDTNVHAALYWGHSSNCESQMDRVKAALEKVELLVDIDPFVTNTAVLPDRQDNVYLLPAATVYEQSGSVTNSNRDVQWRNRIVKPVFEARTDLEIMVDFANRLGFGKEFAKNQKGPWSQDYEKMVEDVAGEWALGMRTIGMVGQSVARMKRQMEYAHVFDRNTKMATSGPVRGEQWGLPWPCWTDKHPGTQILYDVDLPVAKGGMGFRARWGTKAPDGESLLAGKGSAPVGSSVKGGYAELDKWKTDLTGKVFEDAIAKGLAPYGNGRARISVWTLKDDPVPKHREPIHTPRPDLIAKWPTYDDVKEQFRVPTLFKSLQKPEWAKDFPVVLNTGRQVEFEGGGAAERACWWLVELQPEMYAEINPTFAAQNSIKHGDWMWIESPQDTDPKPSRMKVKAKVTKRVPPGMVFLPFHWGGAYDGKTLAGKFPDGSVPYGIGESANTVTNYGYDRITQMQETKGGLCRISKA
ncbi:MAG TPA: formate dehydrogenase subunit alpha [bacterium]|nr:formate dehydrogenase subunit alpha [bacterium]